jgi:hypothetical protein
MRCCCAPPPCSTCSARISDARRAPAKPCVRAGAGPACRGLGFVARDELLQFLAQLLALEFAFDTLRNADVPFLRQIHEQPAGDADLRRQPRSY